MNLNYKRGIVYTPRVLGGFNMKITEYPEQPEFVSDLEDKLGAEIKYLNFGKAPVLLIYTSNGKETKRYIVKASFSALLIGRNPPLNFKSEITEIDSFNTALDDYDFSNDEKFLEEPREDKRKSVAFIRNDNMRTINRLVDSHWKYFHQQYGDWILEQMYEYNRNQ